MHFLCLFTIILLLCYLYTSLYISALAPPPRFWETLVTEKQIYSGHNVFSIGQKHSSWVSGTQKPRHHMTFYPPKWKLRARWHHEIISKRAITCTPGTEQIYPQKQQCFFSPGVTGFKMNFSVKFQTVKLAFFITRFCIVRFNCNL